MIPFADPTPPTPRASRRPLRTLFPVLSVDGATIALKRPRMRDGYLEIVVSITLPEPSDDGLVTSEWWIRPFDCLLTTPELEARLERLAHAWSRATAETVATAIDALPRAYPRADG